MPYARQIIGRAHRVGRQPEDQANGVDVDNNFVAPWAPSRYRAPPDHQVRR